MVAEGDGFYPFFFGKVLAYLQGVLLSESCRGWVSL